MKIVDAFWEKRNLGLNCTEITVEADDDVEAVEKAVNENASEYTVVRVPACKSDAMFAMPRMGFTFVECLINLVHELKSTALTGIYKRFNDCMTYHSMSDDDKKQLLNEIDKGIFETDRVFLDPFFPKELAAKRYVNWVGDEIAAGTEVFKVCYRDKDIGFFYV